MNIISNLIKNLIKFTCFIVLIAYFDFKILEMQGFYDGQINKLKSNIEIMQKEINELKIELYDK